MSHAPGSWTIEGNEPATGLVCAVNRIVADVFGDGVTELQANTRLVAAAPDLLDACESVARDLEDACDVSDATIRKVREAITKAKGESQ